MRRDAAEAASHDAGLRIVPLEPVDSTPSLWDALRRHKRVMIVCLAISAGVGVYQAATGVPIYRARSTVLLLPRGGHPVLRASVPVETQQQNLIGTHMEIIRSPEVVAKAVAAARLDAEPSLAGAAAAGTLVEDLIKGLSTQRDPATQIFSLEYASPERQLCARVVNAVVDAYVQYMAETQRDTSAQVLQMLIAEKEKTEDQLRQKNAEMLKLQESRGLWVTGKDGESGVMDRLTSLNEMYVQARLLETEAKAKYEMIKRAADSGGSMDPYTMANALAGLPVTAPAADEALHVSPPWQASQARALRVQALRLEIARLSEELGPRHPRIQELNDQLALLGATTDAGPEVRFEASLGRPLNVAGRPSRAGDVEQLVAMFEQQYKVRQAVREKLEKDYQAERARSLDRSSDRTQLLTLQSDIRQLTRQRDRYVDQINALDFSSEVGSLTVRVLARAKTPMVASSTGGVRTVVMAVIVGVCIGLGVVMSLDKLDKSFRSPDDVKAALQLPVLGNIPGFDKDAGSRSSHSCPLVVHARPKSIEAEAFRSLRTVIGYTAHRQGLKTFLVTSPNPGDGKTTVVSNLACAIASLGSRVLVIDGDLRHRKIHAIFQCENHRGLTEYLSGREDAWEPYVQPTPIANVEVIPAGRRPDNPAELLGSPRFAELLTRVKAVYDAVLIDSAPVLLVTDGTVVASQVDATILLVKIAKNEKPTAVAAKEALDAVDAHLIGVVLNDVSAASRYGYAYYNRYYYRYGQGYYHYYHRPRAEKKTA